MPFDAVCFDFWNTVLVSDEAALEAARLRRWQAVLADAGHDRSVDELRRAHRVATAAYSRHWIRNEQYVVADATATMLDSLAIELDPPGVEALTTTFSAAGHDAAPPMCPGVGDALAALKAAGVSTAIVCDIGLTPADVCRDLLAGHGLLDRFDVTVFSDEYGSYKPDPAIFHHTLDRLGCSPAAAAHVGDRRRTDVEGARRAGLTPIRYAGVFDDDAGRDGRDSRDSRDDADDAPIVIDHHDRLLAALASAPAVR